MMSSKWQHTAVLNSFGFPRRSDDRRASCSLLCKYMTREVLLFCSYRKESIQRLIYSLATVSGLLWFTLLLLRGLSWTSLALRNQFDHVCRSASRHHIFAYAYVKEEAVVEGTSSGNPSCPSVSAGTTVIDGYGHRVSNFVPVVHTTRSSRLRRYKPVSHRSHATGTQENQLMQAAERSTPKRRRKRAKMRCEEVNFNFYFITIITRRRMENVCRFVDPHCGTF